MSVAEVARPELAAAPPEPARPAVVTRPRLGQLLGLAWPVIISRSSQVVVGFTDAAMCARLGEDALAATTAGATNTFNFFILPMGIAFIVSSFSSQLSGSGDTAGARRYGFYGLFVSVLAAVAGIAAIPFVDVGLAQLSYSPHVNELMSAYLKLRLLSAGFAVGLEALGNFYGGLGNTRLPMVAQIIAMILNVLLCWVLIYGELGAPAMGVAGAGLAASLATALAFVFLLVCFLTGVGQPKPSAARPKTPLSWHELVRMLRIGLPVGLNWFVEFAAFSFFMNIVVAGLGTTALAAVMAVLQLNSISFMPAFGLANAGAIFVGQAIGAGKHDDVPRTVRLTFLTSASWMMLVGAASLVMPAVLMQIFAPGQAAGSEFLVVGTRILMLSAAWQIFDAISMTIAEALRAAGDTAFTLWARAAVAWGVFVPGAWISVRVFGAGDVVASLWLVIYLALLAAVMWFRFRTGKWRTMEITHGLPGH